MWRSETKTLFSRQTLMFVFSDIVCAALLFFHSYISHHEEYSKQYTAFSHRLSCLLISSWHRIWRIAPLLLACYCYVTLQEIYFFFNACTILGFSFLHCSSLGVALYSFLRMMAPMRYATVLKMAKTWEKNEKYGGQ